MPPSWRLFKKGACLRRPALMVWMCRGKCLSPFPTRPRLGNGIIETTVSGTPAQPAQKSDLNMLTNNT